MIMYRFNITKQKCFNIIITITIIIITTTATIIIMIIIIIILIIIIKVYSPLGSYKLKWKKIYNYNNIH